LKGAAEGYGRTPAALITGLVWACYHAPILYLASRTLGTGNPYAVALIQMTNIFVFSIAYAFIYYTSGSIIPCMVIHYVWNAINPIVLGDLYLNIPGLMTGHLLLINGEGLMGIIIGALFIPLFVIKWRKKTSVDNFRWNYPF
jgi:membrane protease YdiL (CAAX protease family)